VSCSHQGKERDSECPAAKYFKLSVNLISCELFAPRKGAGFGVPGGTETAQSCDCAVFILLDHFTVFAEAVGTCLNSVGISAYPQADVLIHRTA